MLSGVEDTLKRVQWIRSRQLLQAKGTKLRFDNIDRGRVYNLGLTICIFEIRYNYWDQLSRFHSKVETESSLRNVVF
jgi:hypothetical protein